jgi:hypothetical protein
MPANAPEERGDGTIPADAAPLAPDVFPGDAVESATAFGASAPARTEAARHGWRVLAILSALMGFASISTDLYLPAMPAMGQALGADAGMVELTVSGYLIPEPISSDRWQGLENRLFPTLSVSSYRSELSGIGISPHQLGGFLAQEHVGVQRGLPGCGQLAGKPHGHHRRRFFRHIGEKIRNRDIKGPGQVEQPAGSDTIGSALVFLDLLEGQAQGASQLFLAYAQQKTTQAQSAAHMGVDLIGDILRLAHHFPHPSPRPINGCVSDDQHDKIRALIRPLR